MSGVISEEEAIKRLEAIHVEFSENQDSRHVEEDELLCEVLESLGYSRLVALYSNTGKWYG